MRWFDVGQEATGVIAIGQQATGVIAIGQLATGVVAIGQLARGVFVIGQVAVGVAAFGQVVVALTYGGGLAGVAGVRSTPSLAVWGVAGRGRILCRRRLQPSFERARFRSNHWLTALRVATFAAIVAVVVWLGLGWIPDHFSDGIDGVPTPPPPTYAPGTR